MTKDIMRILLIVAFILSIPLVGMQFSDEVDWTLLDFVLAGVVLFTAGFVYTLLKRTVDQKTYRYAVGTGIFGMAYVMFLAAAVQMFVPVAAFTIFQPDFSPGVIAVFAINAFFALFFIVSGMLFKQAGKSA